MTFTHREVSMQFCFYRYKAEALMDRLKDFVDRTPINRQRPDGYGIRNVGFDWEHVYSREIIAEAELAEMSAPEVADEVIRWLGDFIDAEDSEYRRIGDYFRCLSFGLGEAGSDRES